MGLEGVRRLVRAASPSNRSTAHVNTGVRRPVGGDRREQHVAVVEDPVRLGGHLLRLAQREAEHTRADPGAEPVGLPGARLEPVVVLLEITGLVVVPGSVNSPTCVAQRPLSPEILVPWVQAYSL